MKEKAFQNYFFQKDKRRRQVFQCGTGNCQYGFGIFCLKFELVWNKSTSISRCEGGGRVGNVEEEREKEEKRVLLAEIVSLDPLAIMNSDWRKIWVNVAHVRPKWRGEDSSVFNRKPPLIVREHMGIGCQPDMLMEKLLVIWYS